MMDSEGHIWEDYIDLLKEKYLKSGLNDLNAQLRAESYNIWSQLGFSYNSLKKECQDYLAKKDNGGCLDGDEFPQVYKRLSSRVSLTLFCIGSLEQS